MISEVVVLPPMNGQWLEKELMVAEGVVSEGGKAELRRV